MLHPTDRIAHTTAFVAPVVEHWLEREILPVGLFLLNKRFGLGAGLYIPQEQIRSSCFGDLVHCQNTNKEANILVLFPHNIFFYLIYNTQRYKVMYTQSLFIHSDMLRFIFDIRM